MLLLPYSSASIYMSIPKQFPTSPLPLWWKWWCWLDYCNSLYHNLPKSQITRLQQIQNSLARAVVKAPKSNHITPILRSLLWLKITHLPAKFSQPPNIHICITPSSQHSLFIIGQTRSSIHIIFSTNNRSFLPVCFPSSLESTSAPLRQPRTKLSNSASPSCMSGTSSIGSIDSPLSSSIRPSPLHSSTPGLKLSFSANPSHHSLPFLLLDWLHGFPGLFTDTSEHIRFFLSTLPVLHC